MLLSCSDIITLHDINDNTSDFKPNYCNDRHKGGVNVAIYNHNCRVIASGGEDGIINFYNSTLDYISSIEDSDLVNYAVSSICFNGNSNYLGYSSNSGNVKIWDLKSSTSQLSNKFSNENYFPSCLTFNNDSNMLTVGTSTGNIVNFLLDNLTNSPIVYKSLAFGKITQVKYSPFLINTLGFSSEDGSVRIFDVINGVAIANFGASHSGIAAAISFSPINSAFLTSCGLDGKINFYDVIAKKVVKCLNTKIPLTSIAFNIDGQTVAVGNYEGSILVYDLRYSSAPKCVLQGHTSEVKHLEFCKKPNNTMHRQSTSSCKYDLNSSKLNRSNTSIESASNINLGNNISTSQLNSTQRNHKIPLVDKERTANIQQSVKQEPLKNVKDLPKEKESFYHNSTLKDVHSSQIQEGNIQVLKQSTKNIPSSNLNSDRMVLDETKGLTGSMQLNKGNVQNLQNKTDLDNKTQDYIKTLIETEMFKLKQFIHEEVNSLHVDLIRQFEIQHVELVRSLKNFSLVNNKMAKEVDRLKKENENLKSQFF